MPLWQWSERKSCTNCPVNLYKSLPILSQKVNQPDFFYLELQGTNQHSLMSNQFNF